MENQDQVAEDGKHLKRGNFRSNLSFPEENLSRKVEELIAENERLRFRNLSLTREIEVWRGENERLKVENCALAEELQNLRDGMPDVVRRTGMGNCAANDVDCLNFDVAKRILETLNELSVYVSYDDAELRRLWCNEAAGRFNRKDMLFIQKEGLQLKLKALKTGEPQKEDKAVQLSNEDQMVWRIVTLPHFNKQGAVIGISMASVNITEQVKLKECLCKIKAEITARKVMEDELRQAMKLTEEAVQAKNVFLAIMSHEIRTPLNGLLGLAEALETSELNAEQKELVSTILSSGVIVADVLGDILDLASMEFGMMDFEELPFSPAGLVEDIKNMAVAASHEKDVTVNSEVASTVPNTVICDPLRLRQVMKYLVLNAIKFTHKGTVSICMGIKSDCAKEVITVNKRDDFFCENTQSTEEENAVSRSGFDEQNNAQGNLFENTNSFVVDMNSFLLKLPESCSRTAKEDTGRAADFSKDARYLQEYAGEFMQETFPSPAETSLVGRLELQLEASESNHQISKNRNSNDWGATKDMDNSDEDFSYQHLLYCEITDTGLGIPTEAFETPFNKFTQINDRQTRTYGGTGLGLAICKQLVELMGGQLTVESKIGKGSKFIFTVKCKVSKHGLASRRLENLSSAMQKETCLASESHLACTKGASGTNPKADTFSMVDNSKRNPRILLAEDNKVNVMVAVSMLKRLGFTAKVVANGVEALEAIRKDKYDLILLDICMPLMDGLQVAYAVRKFEETGQWPDGELCNLFSLSHVRSQALGNTSASQIQMNKGRVVNTLVGEDLITSDVVKHIPIIAVSANALRSEIEKCFACGMDAFISKPVVFQKLQEILERYLPQHKT